MGSRVIGIPASGGRDRLRAGDELGELAQVLDGGGEVEFVTSAARTAQPQSVELRDAFEMCEQHLDLFLLAERGVVGLGLGDTAGEVACALVDRAQNFTGQCIGAAARLQRTSPAVVRAGPVTEQVVLRQAGSRRGEPPAIVLEDLSGPLPGA